ncbi:tail length tape measure protein [Arthrobacter phage Kumotta]|uniref:Tape measure protein n=1 Tax=Arthrobacter phage Kumotta TaxID=2588498 RepID=A0A4Y6END3_9CAUD|nr:tail length tape measure protein [Arthrobacter phage Kumotta]QDF19527.1 tape measure protein [Arthrobacter phage Kumotta]
MAQAQDTVWLPVLPSMKDFGPALVKGAGSEADKAGSAVGKRFGSGIAAGVALAVGAVAAAGGALYKVGTVFSDVSTKIAVGTGAAGKDLQGLNDAAKRVGSSMPRSFEDIAGAVTSVKTSIGGLGDMSEAEFDQATKNALNFSKAFEMDTDRVTQVVGQMLKTGLVGNANEAFDLLTAAAQKVPAAVREDVIDAVDEYGPFFTQLGIKGSDAMGMLVAASEKGMYGIDKTGDALKEFTIRATDMSKATSGAYEALGLNTEQMTKDLLAGGETGAAAFQKIVGALNNMKDPVAQSQAALALFGTPLEDLGTEDIPKFIASLSGAQTALGDTEGAASRMGDTLNNSVGAKFEIFKNQIMVWLEPLASGMLSGLTWLFGEIAGGVTAFGTAFSEAGTEVTSSGLAGFLELVGLGLGGIWDILSRGDFTGKLTTAFGWEEDHPMVSFLFTVRDVLTEAIGGVKAFGSAWAANDGDITSSGFPGFMEALAFQLHQAFDYVTGTVIPALASFAQFLWDNRGAIVALATGVAAYMAVMQTMSFISTVRGWITAAAAAQWGLNAAMSANPIGLIVAGIAALVAGLVWFFTQTELGQQIVTNVWGAIQSFIGGTVEWFQTYVLPTVEAIFAGVGAVFSWLYSNIIQPVFAQISWAAQAAWSILDYIFQIIGAVITKVVGPAFSWLWSSIIQPVFGFIGALISFWWNTTVKPIFDALVWVLNNVLGPAFNWLWQTIIKPAFDGIGAAISWVWENIVKPVFTALSDFITKTIPKAFEDGVSFIKTAWDKLQEIAKAPVRFVVDTVINDGLINGLNGIGGMLGLDPLPRVALPPGFATGGYTGEGGKYQPAGIVHAGEFVFTKEQTRRAGVRNLYAMANALAGYATGGLVRPINGATISQPFHGGHNGIDFAAPTGTPIFAAGPGRVSSAGWSSYGGGNEIHIDHPNGLQTWYAHLSSFAVKLGQMVSGGSKIGEVGSTGNSTGPHLHYMVLNGGWPNYVNPAAYLDGGGEAGSGWNPIAAIVDGLIDQFKKAFPQAGMFADLAIGAGKKLLDGAVAFVTGNGGKDDGIGTTGLPYLHDQGGILPPGLSSVMNRTRKPEYILNPQQWSDIHQLALGGGSQLPPVNIEHLHVRDEDEVVRKLETHQRDLLAVYAH